jgi:hypothetical protein
MSVFTPAVINDLRAIVGQHNDQVGSDASARIRLTQAKSLYKRWFNGQDPHRNAIAQMEKHLGGLRENLAKATGPFDAGRHPRGRGGRFRRGGGGAPPARRRDRDDELLTAAQTQVIPETRYTLYGAPVAGAVGLGAGAYAGATASLKPGRIDRIAGAAVRGAGAMAGGVAGAVGAALAFDVPKIAAHDAIQAINHRYGTTIPTPTRSASAARVGWRVGRKIGGAAAHHGMRAASIVPVSLPLLARRGAEWYGGGTRRWRIAGRGLGGLIGVVAPGLLYARSLHDTQEKVGPYLDTAFPRRVKKLAGEMFNAPEVLAKQAELLGADDLAKVSLGAAGRVIRDLAGRFRPARAAIGGAAAPLTPAQQAAETAFGLARQPVKGEGATVRNLGIGRAGYVAQHAATLAGVGTGVGSIAGLAAGTFNEKHPRGARGRFRTKAEGARSGAYIGAAVGAGLGIATGLAAASRGHGALLAEALARMRGKETPEGMSLPAAMATDAERRARTIHAHAYREANAKKIPPFASEGREPEHVAEAIQRNAVRAWLKREGTAMQAGAAAFYQHQLDRGFDVIARRRLGKLGDALVDESGKAVKTDLAENVDPTKLSKKGQEVWASMMKRRDKALGDIGELYKQRTEKLAEVGGNIEELKAEQEKLKADLSLTPDGMADKWDEIKSNEDVGHDEIRDFAKSQLGLTLKSRAQKGMIAEVDAYWPTWKAKVNTRLNQIEEQLPQLGETHTSLSETLKSDLTETERHAVKNPFPTQQYPGPYFKNRPAGFDSRQVQQKFENELAAKALKPFIAGQKEHAETAIAHLNALVQGHIDQLEAGIPKTGFTMRMFRRYAPTLVSGMQQAAEDIAEVSTADRESLTGAQRAIYDFAHQNKNPVQAAQTAWDLAVGAKNWAAHYHDLALRNWKTISGTAGLLTGLGIIDLQHPDWKQKVRVDHRKWGVPKDIGVVMEFPDPIKRPDEALFGLKFKDKQNRERFLHGIYITNNEGAHNTIPFNTEVDRVRNQVFGGGGGGGGGGNRSDPIKMDAQATKEVENVQRHIKDVGPAGFEFKQRQGGNADKAQGAVVSQLYKDHLKFFDDNKLRQGISTKHAKPYWHSLSDVFDRAGSEVLDLAGRSRMVFGTKDVRGIFANRDRVFQSGDNKKITSELVNQITKVHSASNPYQYTQMKRAIWLAGEHFKLNANDLFTLHNALDQDYTRGGNTVPEEAPKARSGGSQSFANLTTDTEHFEALYNQLVDPTHARYVAPEDRHVSYHDNDRMRDDLHANYFTALRLYRTEHPDAALDIANAHAAREARQFINEEVKKAERIGDLAKQNVPNTPSVGRIPRVRAAPIASSMPRNIGGAAPLPGSPALNVPGAPSYRQDLKRAVQPSHVLGQLGTYGLSQLGFEAVKGITSHLLPGGGRLGGLARFGAGAAGGVAGSIYGERGGKALGAKIGGGAPAPKSDTEQLVGNLGGTAGQIAFDHFGAQAASRGAVALGARVLGGTVGTALDPFIGPVGTAAGAAVAGYLADEGMSILYRHLSRYGSHVPKMAAAKLGHPAQS